MTSAAIGMVMPVMERFATVMAQRTLDEALRGWRGPAPTAGVGREPEGRAYALPSAWRQRSPTRQGMITRSSRGFIRMIQRPLYMSLTYARPSRTTTPQVMGELGT